MVEMGQEFGRARRQILSDSLSKVSFEEATALVGILFDNRIVVSERIFNPDSQRTNTQSFELQPLEPQEAARLVAEVFQCDCDQLFASFQRSWFSVQHSTVVKELKVAIQMHPMVSQLDAISTLE